MTYMEREFVYRGCSEAGGINWENEWRMNLLTKKINIDSLVTLSLNRSPTKVSRLLSLRDEIIEDKNSLEQELDNTYKKTYKTNSFQEELNIIYYQYQAALAAASAHITLIQAPCTKAMVVIDKFEERIKIIKPHLEKLDTKPVEIKGKSTVKCDIASFVALLVHLDLPHPKELADYAIEQAGSLELFRKIVQQLANPENINTNQTNLVEYNGKMVKPSTKEKYQKWQIEVEKQKEKCSYQSHSAICTRIASKLKVSPETIRRNTSL